LLTVTRTVPDGLDAALVGQHDPLRHGHVDPWCHLTLPVKRVARLFERHLVVDHHLRALIAVQLTYWMFVPGTVLPDPRP
jgi:hypothetical protein